MLVLLARWLAGRYFVNHIVVSDTVRPAAHDAWQIITQSLAAAGWVSLSVGVLIAVGAWLVGPGARATSARTAMAPALRRPLIAWGGFVIGILLILAILPIQNSRTSVVLVVGSAIGFLIFTRQVAAEVPAPAPAASAAPTPPPPPDPS